MTEAIDFTKKYEFEVEVSDAKLGSVGSGILNFGPENWAQINFGLLDISNEIPEGKIFRALKAKTETGKTFTLFDCKRIHYSITATYVVEGDISENIKGIEVRYSDISEWFFQWQRIEGKVGKSIVWENCAEHFSASIKTEFDHLSLISKSETSITRSGEDHILHEHVLFFFEHISGHFSPEDIRTKSQDLSNLLSILIASPLAIISIQVVCENGLKHGAFFPAFKPMERDISGSNSPHRFFTSKKLVHDRWEIIVNRYFNSDYRKVSWTRLAGMQRYEGFWEYRALGYVTLLDKYVDQHYRESNNNKKIAASIEEEKKLEIDKAVKEIFPLADKNQADSLIQRLDDILAYKRKPSFSEKYQFSISKSNQDMMKIINISDSDFKLIKDVRDDIAHGDALELPDDGFGRINSIISKIELLLTYWAFKDFGLTDNDFLHCLNTTHSPLRLRSQPNQMHIDRLIKPENFFSVSKEDLDRFSSIKNIRINACFAQGISGSIDYSEEYSAAYKKWQADTTKSGATRHADIFGVAQERIKYLTPMYIECGSEHLELPIAWVIEDN